LQLIDQLNDIFRSLSGFTPEVVLLLAIAVVVVADLIFLDREADSHRRLLFGLTALSILVAGALVVGQWPQPKGFLFGLLLLLDNQAVFFKLIVSLAALFAVLHAWTIKQSRPLPLDWLPIFLALLLGLYLMAMSVNLLAIYLSIELVSLSSYLLTALARDRKASEGGIKYLLFGAVSSAIMLYGMSLLYGLTGTLDLTSSVVEAELAKNSLYVVYLAGILTLSGIFFKLSLVPFHVWTPDTYDAAPTPIAAFFSVGPKAAALLVLMRVLTALPTNFQTPLAVVALASITLGNLSALWQTDAKRLLAYSSIAHAGFLLVGIVAFNETGFEAATFYIATYLFINLAAFLLIDLLAQQRGGSLTLQEFSGLGTTQPLISVVLTLIMIALAGLPPTVGFTAKLLAFSALLEAYQTSANGWLLALFGIGLLNVVISLFFYLRIPLLLFFRPAPGGSSPLVALTRSQFILGALLALPVVAFFFKPEWLLQWIEKL